MESFYIPFERHYSEVTKESIPFGPLPSRLINYVTSSLSLTGENNKIKLGLLATDRSRFVMMTERSESAIAVGSRRVVHHHGIVMNGVHVHPSKNHDLMSHFLVRRRRAIIDYECFSHPSDLAGIEVFSLRNYHNIIFFALAIVEL